MARAAQVSDIHLPAPVSATALSRYARFTKHGSKELNTPKRLANGALAGITSVCSTYPLGLVRSRLSIATATIALSAAAAQSASRVPSMTTAAAASTRLAQGSIPKYAVALFHSTKFYN